MNNKRFSLTILAIALLFLFVAFLSEDKRPAASPVVSTSPVSLTQDSFNGTNSIFTIDGKQIMLVNGSSETYAAPGSASKITVRYFGNTAEGDLNGDGLSDAAYLVTSDNGGSGTFYYVVAALRQKNGQWKTTNAFLIGDRIAPQTTEINESAHELYVNFSQRKPGEPMSAKPSQGATLYLKVTANGVLEGVMK